MGKRKQNYMCGIQREQLKLVKIQRELESVLLKINEGINALKVEELQLKSISVTKMKLESDVKPQISNNIRFGIIESNEDDLSFQDEAEFINNQDIDLDSFTTGQYNADFLNDEDE